MKLEFFNCPEPEKIDAGLLPERPEFVKYIPDFLRMQELAKKYEVYEQILVIGHGGSITSFYGLYHALKAHAKKKVWFLSTVDPDYIYELKKELKPENTLVLAISKSGENTTQLEAMAHFLNYHAVVITGEKSPLRELAEKMKLEIVIHPPIGGRYTGMTEVALLPAAMIGLDVADIYKGAKLFYDKYASDNLAMKAASVFYQLEQDGYVDVFLPFYSHALYPLSALIVQLCHESFGKSGRGQTYLPAEAPESQHHTNQRFLGGRKNMAGFFTTSDSVLYPSVTLYPTQAHGVILKNHPLFDLNKIPLEKSLDFESHGTMEDAKVSGIPFAHLSISGYKPEEAGGLVAFWELYAVYASVLREVNPFDQPAVENSKALSFRKRLEFNGLG